MNRRPTCAADAHLGAGVGNGRVAGDGGAAAGDRTAEVRSSEEDFERWCAAAWPRLVRIVAPWCDDLAQAEDIAQESLCRSVERFDRTGEIGPLAWVTTVAMNLARSRLRRLRVQRRHAARSRVLEPIGEPDLLWLEVVQALGALPDRQRTAVVLRYLGDLSVDDTASVMDCSPATVKAHVRDAFVTLRAAPELTRADPDEEVLWNPTN